MSEQSVPLPRRPARVHCAWPRLIGALLLTLIWLGARPAMSALPEGAPANPPQASVQDPGPDGAAEESGPETVKVGLYITQLADFDMPRRSFSAQLWLWFLHTGAAYKPIDSIEVVNAKTSATRAAARIVKSDVPWGEGRANVIWDQAKYSVTLLEDWSVPNYPFDRQRLQIQIEDSQSDLSQIALEPDSANSRIDEQVAVPGWKILSFSLHGEPKVYNTTYGDPTLQGNSTYARIVATIVVQRDGMRLMFSAFIGFFVAYALTGLTYWLSVADLAAARIGLSGGAIFAAVGNKYVVDNSVPPSAGFTLSDGIQASTFLAILFALATVVGLDLLRRYRPGAVRGVNAACAATSLVAYVGFNGVLIARAMQP